MDTPQQTIEPPEPPKACSMQRLVSRFRAWVCRKVGHSFSNVDLLMFKIKSEGRCYTVNLVTGERAPLNRPPEITCRRCGVRLVGKATNDQAERCRRMNAPNNTQDAMAAFSPATGSALPDYGHLMDYVLDLHIIVGPSGMCRCGEDGITCSERLRCVSHEIGSALLGAHMAKSMGGEKFAPNDQGVPTCATSNSIGETK